MWSPDGSELFYRRSDARFLIRDSNQLVGVDITTEPGLVWGNELLLPISVINTGASYDIMPDGQRFVIVALPDEIPHPRINVVLNWFEELKERVPVP